MSSKLPSRLGNLKIAHVNYVILLFLGLDALNVVFQQTAIFITIDFVRTAYFTLFSLPLVFYFIAFYSDLEFLKWMNV